MVTTKQVNDMLRLLSAGVDLGHLSYTIHGTRSALCLVASELLESEVEVNRFLGWSSTPGLSKSMRERYCRAVQVYVSFARSMPTADEVVECMAVGKLNNAARRSFLDALAE